MKLTIALLVAAFGKELTPADWDTETAGKTVFIKSRTHHGAERNGL